MPFITKNIEFAAQKLRDGEVIAIPTETVYGLAGNAFDCNAVKRIFEIKGRPMFNPLIVHIASAAQLSDLTTEIPDAAKSLAEELWPGPITLLLPKSSIVPNVVTAGLPAVAVRMPAHPVATALLEAIDFPLAAPSANKFTGISPTSAEHVASAFVDYDLTILDGGSCDKGVESTIIGFSKGAPILYRLGAVSIEKIEKITGKLKFVSPSDELKPAAPGMMKKHYSPRTPLILVESVDRLDKTWFEKNIGVISFTKNIRIPENISYEVLSNRADPEEACANLYAALYRLDSNGLDLIVAELLPNAGLGATINDRLRRAASNIL